MGPNRFQILSLLKHVKAVYNRSVFLNGKCFFAKRSEISFLTFLQHMPPASSNDTRATDYLKIFCKRFKILREKSIKTRKHSSRMHTACTCGSGSGSGSVVPCLSQEWVCPVPSPPGYPTNPRTGYGTRDQEGIWDQRDPLREQTRTSENITFKQLRWRAVTSFNSIKILFM